MNTHADNASRKSEHPLSTVDPRVREGNSRFGLCRARVFRFTRMRGDNLWLQVARGFSVHPGMRGDNQSARNTDGTFSVDFETVSLS